MISVEKFLESHNIEYIVHEHPAVFTCEEAEKHCADIPGIACKNLFLKSKKRDRFLLLILPADKKVDIKKFAEIVGLKNKMSFAHEDELKEKLHVEPGSVSVFCILNDSDNAVELYIDKDVYDADIVSFHPNVNTATLELNKDMFHRFLDVIKTKVEIIDL